MRLGINCLMPLPAKLQRLQVILWLESYVPSFIQNAVFYIQLINGFSAEINTFTNKFDSFSKISKT
jgi:hypothetical protein